MGKFASSAEPKMNLKGRGEQTAVGGIDFLPVEKGLHMCNNSLEFKIH